MRRTVSLLLLVSASCTGSIDGGPSVGAEPPVMTMDPRGGGGRGGTGGGGAGGTRIGDPPIPPSASCKAPEAGPAPLRRLTRRQYNKAVQRLFGNSKLTPASTFIEDERVEPFTSNLDASPTDAVVGQYLGTAEELAAANAKKLADALKCAAGGEPECGKKFIAEFGRKAFRRPLTEDEAARYQKLFDGERAGGIAAGVQQVVQTMLQSPHFLYHVESWSTPDRATGVSRLDPYALASRLSFFLTGGPPDEALLAAAAKNELGRPADVAVQARRLIATADGQEAMIDFHRHWFEIDKISRAPVDAKAYPTYDAAARANAEAEADAFIKHVMTVEKGRLDTLLTAPFTVNAKGERIDGDPARQAGLITNAAVLTVSPRSVQRGRMVRTFLLCQPVPPPPIELVAELPPAVPGKSTRNRWETVMNNETCGACHRLMNPIGFALDNYDETGRWRDKEGELPIDRSGALVDTGDADGPFDGPVALAARLAKSSTLHLCATEQWARYALGRDLTAAERCGLDALTKTLVDAGLDVRELMVAIASSPFFVQVKSGTP